MAPISRALWQILFFSQLHNFGKCEYEELLFSCDFGTEENETLCNMTQGQEDDFDWELTSTSRKSDTGPQSDRNGVGEARFLWVDSEENGGGDKAVISTPPFNLTAGMGLLTFYYHMYGAKMGSLSISVCEGGNATETLSKDQANVWHQLNVTFTCGEQAWAQVTFTSQINAELSDMAIDDIFLYDIWPTTTAQPKTGLSSTASEVTTSSASSPALTSSEKDTGSTDTTDGGSTEINPTEQEITTPPVVGTTVEGDGSSSEQDITTPAVTETTVEGENSPRVGMSVALPVSMSLVAVVFLVALVVLGCFILKRRQMMKESAAENSDYRYSNDAYDLDVDEYRSDTLVSSTWRSAASTRSTTHANGTLDGSQQLETQPSTDPGSEAGADPLHYFVLNPGRASMLVEEDGEVGGGAEDGEEAPGTTHGTPLYDNRPGQYTYIDEDGNPVSTETGGTPEEAEVNGYEPIQIKDDETGGYQVVNEDSVTIDTQDTADPYETVSFNNDKRNHGNVTAPIPAVRQNVPPKPSPRMVDNILYKPLNDEQTVANVLYNPLEGGN